MVPGSQCEGSDHMSKMSSVADVFNPVIKKSPLTINKKIYEFYTAPITKFWMHTVSVTAVLLCLSLSLSQLVVVYNCISNALDRPSNQFFPSVSLCVC